MTTQERFLAVVQAATDASIAEHLAGFEAKITRVEANQVETVVNFERNDIRYELTAVAMTNYAGTHHGYGYTIKPVDSDSVQDAMARVRAAAKAERDDPANWTSDPSARFDEDGPIA